MADPNAAVAADSQVRASRNAFRNAVQARTPGNEDLGKQDFLNLLMTQMQNQDPLDPMDSEGMMNQLTSMGQLEQLISVNENMGRLKELQSDIARANTFSFLDKDVVVPGGSVRVSEGETPELQYRIPREAEAVHVKLANDQGEPVRTLELGPQGPGQHTVNWDGTDSDGQRVAPGLYRYEVAARDSEGQNVPTELYVQGKVSGVSFSDGQHKLKVNGAEYNIQDVKEMNNRSERTFGNEAPRPMRQEMAPRPPLDAMERNR